MSTRPKYILFGGTGFVGSRVLQYALEESVDVTLFTRYPATAIKWKHNNLQIITGSVHKYDDVRAAIKGHTAVISTLGGPTRDCTRTSGLRNIVNAMQEEKVERLVFVGNAGVLSAEGEKLVCELPNFPIFMKDLIIQDFEAWQMCKITKLKWTMVCPVMISVGQRTARFKIADHEHAIDTAITAENLADFILKEVKYCKLLGLRVGIGDA